MPDEATSKTAVVLIGSFGSRCFIALFEAVLTLWLKDRKEILPYGNLLLALGAGTASASKRASRVIPWSFRRSLFIIIGDWHPLLTQDHSEFGPLFSKYLGFSITTRAIPLMVIAH